MQNDMGSQGILSNYRPPYQNFMFKNYPIILNMIPELRAAFDDILLSKLAGQYSSALQESIVRHIGSIEDFLDRQRGELKNPIIWTREGVRSLAGIPANFLGWIGLISSSTAWRINSSLIFKIFSGALSLIGFVSAIITIALGWDQFLTLIDSIIKKII